MVALEMPPRLDATSSLEKFCSRVLSLHEGIRFAGIADGQGELVGSAYRKGLRPLLTQDESKLSVVQSFIRMGIRTTQEGKLGKALYESEVYEKVKRVTIPVRSPTSLHIFMASFDTSVDHEPIILKKIIPLLDDLVL